jgi:hypothetical protein
VAYAGVDGDEPVLTSAGATTGPRSTTITAPSVSTTDDGSRLLAFFAIASTTTITAPPELTPRTETLGVNDLTVLSGDLEQLTAGAAGPYTAETADPGRSVGQLIALRPARR